ncbi:DR2241 family protein [Halocatena halophila]|uniref:DR2241 family protein n=1 Tax=Halocatena halophila TaxID=2814576 RepID=UPI002ECFD438
MDRESDPVAALVAAVAERSISYDGLSVSKSDGLYTFETTERQVTDLTASALGETAAGDPFVDNWFHWTQRSRSTAEQAFLRWVEHAEERSVPERYSALTSGVVVREWGQLRITATVVDGGRRYGLRHSDDRDADPAELERFVDPLKAREIATTDDKGRYRPLKTAPTLSTGWLFPELTGASLVEAIDFIYPATIQNWALEREGELDVTNWADAADRQSGIYAMVDELSGEQLEWLTEACCVDSQCLKRREWDAADGEEIDTPHGAGAFPCREPCSVVISAARKWTQIEREDTERYTVELTPSEKAQLEALVAAVADGRIDEIREAEFSDPANRQRARYLRAKRFDAEGTLSAESDRPN